MVDLFLDSYGMFLGKKSERLVVKKNKKIVEEEPLFKVERVLITSKGVSMSTDAIQECMKSGIHIDFLNFKNEPYAKLSSPFLQGTVKTRRRQLKSFDNGKGIELAREFVRGKIGNQVSLLKYMSKYRKKREPKIYDYMCERIEKIEDESAQLEEMKGDCIDEVRQSMMTLEAHCARRYWKTVRRVLPDDVDFPGRETRGASDLVNCMLNYGYAILYSRVQGAVIRAGLDPYAGFLHVDRPGRASLVLDFMEEFRQQFVDKTVFAMINQGTKLKIDDGRLGEKTKKKYRNKLMDKLNSYVKYENKKHRLKSVIQKQARHIATFLRDERDYKSFQGRW